MSSTSLSLRFPRWRRRQGREQNGEENSTQHKDMDVVHRASFRRRRDAVRAAAFVLHNVGQTFVVGCEGGAHPFYANSTKRRWRGGERTGAPNLKQGNSPWVSDYLDANPTYGDTLFRRRLSVPLKLFWTIYDARWVLDNGFRGTRIVGSNRFGIDSRVKILEFVRVVQTGAAFDKINDGARMAVEKHVFTSGALPLT